MSCKIDRARKLDGLPGVSVAKIFEGYNMASVLGETLRSNVDLDVSKLLKYC